MSLVWVIGILLLQMRAGERTFWTGILRGFVQPTLLTFSLLKEEKSPVTMWKPVLEPELWLGCDWSMISQQPSKCFWRSQGCVRMQSLPPSALSKAQEEGISLSCCNCTGPGPKQMRLNLTHQWGAWWDHSCGLWKLRLRAASVGKLCSLEFFVFPHWLRNYLVLLV